MAAAVGGTLPVAYLSRGTRCHQTRQDKHNEMSKDSGRDDVHFQLVFVKHSSQCTSRHFGTGSVDKDWAPLALHTLPLQS